MVYPCCTFSCGRSHIYRSLAALFQKEMQIKLLYCIIVKGFGFKKYFVIKKDVGNFTILYGNFDLVIVNCISGEELHLRWLVTVSSTFQDLEFDGSL